MFFRRVIAVLLGALLQMSMLGHGLASSAPVGEDCAQAACCCSDLPSCPCVESGDDGQPAPPALPFSQERITPIIAPVDPEIPDFSDTTEAAGDGLGIAEGERFHGYCGVSLRVSFCRYTI